MTFWYNLSQLLKTFPKNLLNSKNYSVSNLTTFWEIFTPDPCIVRTRKEEIGKSYYVFIRMYFPFGSFVHRIAPKRIQGSSSSSMTFVRCICAGIYPLCLLDIHWALKSTKMWNLGSVVLVEFFGHSMPS